MNFFKEKLNRIELTKNAIVTCIQRISEATAKLKHNPSIDESEEIATLLYRAELKCRLSVLYHDLGDDRRSIAAYESGIEDALRVSEIEKDCQSKNIKLNVQLIRNSNSFSISNAADALAAMEEYTSNLYTESSKQKKELRI